MEKYEACLGFLEEIFTKSVHKAIVHSKELPQTEDHSEKQLAEARDE